jgi:phosphatidylethanolamine/phosphatidyl-N-methylethanolamine N-methyltransferase
MSRRRSSRRTCTNPPRSKSLGICAAAEPSSQRHDTLVADVSPSVEDVYQRLAPVYDLIYGVTLAPGRRHAMARLAPAAGESILEIGVGTGLGSTHYPAGCRVVAIDLSGHMLEKARARLLRRRVEQVTLCRMDAAHLAFASAQFDAVYAPYVLNVVPDPAAVAREMARVCRPDGRIVLLNHFDDGRGTSRWFTRLVARLISQIGINWHFELGSFLEHSGLTPASVERVNVPRVSSVVVCHKR